LVLRPWVYDHCDIVCTISPSGGGVVPSYCYQPPRRAASPLLYSLWGSCPHRSRGVVTHFRLERPVAGIGQPALFSVCGRDWTLGWVRLPLQMSATRKLTLGGVSCVIRAHRLSVMSGSGDLVSTCLRTPPFISARIPYPVPDTFRSVGYLFVIWSLPAARHTLNTWYLCFFVAADRLVGLYHSRAGPLLALLYSVITTLHDHDLEPDSCQDPSGVCPKSC
jgi:hypothetical protein